MQSAGFIGPPERGIIRRSPIGVNRGPGAISSIACARGRVHHPGPQNRLRRLSMASANNGLFVWYELLPKDVQAAIAFYTEVVGWKTQPFAEGGDYTMWVGSEGPLGGVMKLPDEAAKMGAPPNWMGNVQVENVDATSALVKKLGGKVYKEPADIPTVGRFAVI